MGDEGISKMTHFGHQDQTSFGHGTAGVGVLLQKTTNHDGEVSMLDWVCGGLCAWCEGCHTRGELEGWM